MEDNRQFFDGIFENYELLLDNSDKRIWRISNVHYVTLNHLRKWLTQDLESLAIDFTVIRKNTSHFRGEVLNQRLSLLPINANPIYLEKYDGDTPYLCSEKTCIEFTVKAYNDTDEDMIVTTEDLKWEPIGENQEEIFEERLPEIGSKDIIIAILSHGQEIDISAYAVRSNPRYHSKFLNILAYHNRSEDKPEILDTIENNDLLCDNENKSCYYFTIELVGGLTFEDIEKQMQLNYKDKLEEDEKGDMILYYMENPSY